MTWDPRAPRPQSRGLRPQVWCTGPDPVLHEKYRVWLQQKNQAQWRDEGWSIGFTDWCDLWAERWDQRGRERGCYCMTRVDWSLPWTLDNVKITTREEHARLQGLARAAGWSSIAQKRARARRGQMNLDLEP
jgi:hypothetical protein